MRRRHDSATFANGENLIRLDLGEAFDFVRRWLLHFDQVHCVGFPHTKVKAQVSLRHDAGTAVHFVHLCVLAGDHAYPCTVCCDTER